MTSLRITAAECVTSIGHSLEETDISLRCMMQRFRRTFLEGTRGRIKAAPVLPIGVGFEGVERGVRLLRPALERCLAGVPGEARLGLVTCVPSFGFVEVMPPKVCEPYEQLRDSWARLPDRVIDVLETRGHVVPKDRRATLAAGQPSGLVALRQIDDWLASSAIDVAALVAVASDCERSLLELFEAWGVTKQEGGIGGYVPSEAAVVILFRRSGPCLARVIAHAAATDPEARQGSPQAIGLTRAMHAVLDAAPPITVSELITDAGGERWRNREIAVSTMRALGSRGLHAKQIGVGRQVGDIGCAGGALNLALAAWAVATDGAGRMCTASSPGPHRAAALLTGGGE